MFTIINWCRKVNHIHSIPVELFVVYTVVYSGFVLYTLIMRSLEGRKFPINDSWKQKIRFVAKKM